MKRRERTAFGGYVSRAFCFYRCAAEASAKLIIEDREMRGIKLYAEIRGAFLEHSFGFVGCVWRAMPLNIR